MLKTILQYNKKGTEVILIHPNSLRNLKKGNPETQFNGRRAVEAGKKSAQARQQYKTLKEVTRSFMTEDVMMQILEAMAAEAMKGNVRAFEALRDTMDGKPGRCIEPSERIDLPVTIVFNSNDADELSG